MRSGFKAGSLALVSLLVCSTASIDATADAPNSQAAVVIDNEYVLVSRKAAPCARMPAPGCEDRVLVALSDLQFADEVAPRSMRRGDVAVFGAGQSYQAPGTGDFVEVALKPDRPPAALPRESIAPEKNSLLHDAPRFFVFEEKLAVGDTRARHSHSQRVIIMLNDVRLEQWIDDGKHIYRDLKADQIAFMPPVIHTVKTIGEQPLRGIVIELKP